MGIRNSLDETFDPGAYDAKYYKIKMADAVPMTIQDRANTSLIWYISLWAIFKRLEVPT
jgi:hypothetical protein